MPPRIDEAALARGDELHLELVFAGAPAQVPIQEQIKRLKKLLLHSEEYPVIDNADKWELFIRLKKLDPAFVATNLIDINDALQKIVESGAAYNPTSEALKRATLERRRRREEQHNRQLVEQHLILNGHPDFTPEGVMPGHTFQAAFTDLCSIRRVY